MEKSVPTDQKAEVVYVIGCNHGIQRGQPDPLWDTPQAIEQQQRFRDLVVNIISDQKIDFIAEEWGLPEKTSAQFSAQENGIGWGNINTTSEELDAMGIPRNYGDGNYAPEEKDQWHRQREQVMLKKIMGQKPGAKRVIVICGFEHAQHLIKSLIPIFTNVIAVDYRQMDWYKKVFSE